MDAEFAAVTATGSGDVTDSYRRDSNLEMGVLVSVGDLLFREAVYGVISIYQGTVL